MFIDPRHLEQLSVIIEAGTLQRAADRIGTSQPALSRMILTLESRVGAALFERNRRPLRPTPLGRELANQGQMIRIARERSVELINQGRKGFFGVLKIGAPPFLCERLVSEAIAGFLAEKPGIRIDLVPDYFPGLHERLFQNQIDIIVGPAKAADPSHAGLLFEPLFEDAIVIVGRLGHPLMTRKITGLDLSEVVWIGHSDRSKIRHDMETALRLMGARNLRFAFQSESAGAVLELVRRSDYLTVLPRYAVLGDTDQLAILPVKLPTADQTIAMMTVADRDESKLTSEFKEHLRRYVTDRFPAGNRSEGRQGP